MKFIRVLKADRNSQKELENALLSQKRAWNYFDKYYLNSKSEAPRELIDFLMSDESSAFRLVVHYLTSGKQLTKEMLNLLKNNNFILTSWGKTIKGITAETLAQITKYITEPDVALSVALALKEKHMDIPHNIKELMIKANKFSDHIKDFDDFDSEGFMHRLAKDPEETLKYISEHGSESLSEQVVMNMIKRLDSYYSPQFINLIKYKRIEPKYYNAILDRIAEDITEEGHRWSETYTILVLFKLFKNKLPKAVIDAVMKDDTLVRHLVDTARYEKITLPQSIVDRAAELSLKSK